MNNLLINILSYLDKALPAYGRPNNSNPTPTPGMKLTTSVNPDVIQQANAQNMQALDMNTPQADRSTPIQQAINIVSGGGWKSKYQDLWEQAAKDRGIDPSVIKLLVTSENGKEDPSLLNANGNNTVDVGLGQVNVPQSDKARIQALQDPRTNINNALDIYSQRLKNLGDPALAFASYNKGARGAATDPNSALERAKYLYQNAGIPLPQTGFTQNPNAFIQQNANKYRQLGILP